MGSRPRDLRDRRSTRRYGAGLMVAAIMEATATTTEAMPVMGNYCPGTCTCAGYTALGCRAGHLQSANASSYCLFLDLAPKDTHR